MWRGVVQYVPLKISLDLELNGFDTLVTSIATLEYSVELHTTSGEQIYPCRECVNNRLSETISYSDFSMVPKGRRAHVKGGITVRCNGTVGHVSSKECVVVLAIY